MFAAEENKVQDVDEKDMQSAQNEGGVDKTPWKGKPSSFFICKEKKKANLKLSFANAPSTRTELSNEQWDFINTYYPDLAKKDPKVILAMLYDITSLVENFDHHMLFMNEKQALQNSEIHKKIQQERLKSTHNSAEFYSVMLSKRGGDKNLTQETMKAFRKIHPDIFPKHIN